jgi:SAM-dependent methyltransferase
MEPELSFRTDLYRGTAAYYDRYRRPYPEALLEDLCRRLAVSGTGRLLDLACGTGQIAIPLAGRFAAVWAVDQERESVAYGQRKADAAGMANITWVAGAAQTVDLEGGFELIAVGNAFHRLDRLAVAARMFSWLRPGGGVALLWGGIPNRGEQPWQRALSVLFEEWIARLGVAERVPAGWEQAMDRHPHEQVLTEAGLDYAGRFEFVVEQAWTLESLAGFAYSTSFINPQALGAQKDRFERDLAERLGPLQPDGVFHEQASFAYQLARKPPES